ncbi:hypothetical protein CRYUN_Cryun14cG0060600 [Craigia yunnanensis]
MRDVKGSADEFAIGGAGGVSGVSWPVLRWGGGKEDKYFAKLGKNMISVYKIETFSLVDKKSLKVENVVDVSWSPTDSILALFVPELGGENQPAGIAWVNKSGESQLEVPIAIRPISETVMYPYYSKWIRGHHDLLLKLNQWCIVFRWEFSNPTPFIRSCGISMTRRAYCLCNKGRGRHREMSAGSLYICLNFVIFQVLQILELYRRIYEEFLAIPVTKGRKSELEKFAGGLYTTSVEQPSQILVFVLKLILEITTHLVVRAVHRDNGAKTDISRVFLVEQVKGMLDKIQQNMFDAAKQKRDACIEVVKTWEEFVTALGKKKLILAPWCDEEDVEKEVKERTKGEMGAPKSLCTPFEQPELPEVFSQSEFCKFHLALVLNALLLGCLQGNGPIGAEVTKIILFLWPSPSHGPLPFVSDVDSFDNGFEANADKSIVHPSLLHPGKPPLSLSLSPSASKFIFNYRHNNDPSISHVGSSSFSGKSLRVVEIGGKTPRLGSSRRRRRMGVRASLGGLLGGIFKGNDTGESTRQQYARTAINRFETEMTALSDAELREKTFALKELASQGESLDSLLPEAFAVVRGASKRVLGLRPFDVQLIGGMVLHKGKLAKMRTGEGKTLVAILPAYLNALTYLNALSGKGVHVVTVKDYLARRDCEWVGQVPRFLGLKVGLIQQNMTSGQRGENYLCDITYSVEELVLRDFNYCIIDEVDSILIDEARTPLIISGTAEKPSDAYYKAAKIATAFERDIHYTVDEKQKTVLLTEQGYEDAEEILDVKDLYDPREQWASYVLNAIKAKEMFLRDVTYIIRGKEVLIVDEFTGRVMQGRRWSDGLHQAVEAKEGLPIQNETVTLASISYQNFFLQDESDVVFRATNGKWQAVVVEISRMNKTRRPVLVGTTSVEQSDSLSKQLQHAGISHEVLNAKPENVEREAEIVAQSGRLGAVTIATNMAGRGTDIILGGNAEFIARLKLREMLMPRVVKPAEGVFVSVKKPPSMKTWKVNEKLFPCKLSGKNTKLAEEAVELAVKTWGKKSLTELEAEDCLSYSCEKGPTQDEVIAKLQSAVLEIVKEYKVYTEEERKQVVAAGGLHVVGTERHESRRIDNQFNLKYIYKI